MQQDGRRPKSGSRPVSPIGAGTAVYVVRQLAQTYTIAAAMEDAVRRLSPAGLKNK
jgi:hypothetical protein